MIRGTTPTHIFNLPISTEIIKDLRITYTQFRRTVIEKNLKAVTLDEKSIRLTLTQEETLQFRTSSPVFLQMKVLTSNGAVLATKVQELSIDEVLNEEVLA